MPQVNIIAKNFMDMVASLPAMKLDKLYENKFIFEAILRSLPPLAKMYVLQMLYIDVPITAKSMEEWVLADGCSKHKVAIDQLIQLRVFTETVDRKKETGYRLNPTFQTNLQKHLICGGILPREPMPSNITVRLPSLEALEAYALEKWECFLRRLISFAQAERPKNFSSCMMEVLQRSLLSESQKETRRLTVNGFQYLLMDTNAQLWYIIREYISNSEDKGVNPADLISFLLELSFHATGEAYNMNTLNVVQRNTIKYLANLGLVKQLKLQKGRKESWFIPTKLATDFSVSLSDSSSRKQEIDIFLEDIHKLLASVLDFGLLNASHLFGGFVIVETNFRMCAYSSSELHCEILCLFSRIEYRLPNLIVCAMTKESLCNAFENGITAEQIISYLQQNAHPRVAEKMPSVPENVTDLIRLWESDLNRIEMTPAHLYFEFSSRVFEDACDLAREWDVLLWEDSKKVHLVVKEKLPI